jgi:myosin heavy subunit
VDDVQEYEAVCEAQGLLGFTSDEQRGVRALLAAILHIGQVDFTQAGDQCQMEGRASLQTAAALLECSVEGLATTLQQRTIKVMSESIRSALGAAQAKDVRDSLCKMLFDYLFTWLIKRINRALNPSQRAHDKFIGVLDIFGFEIFEVGKYF